MEVFKMSNKKKQFYVTIPMLKNVNEATYTYADNPELGTFKSRFPGIPMIKNNISKGDDFEIIALWTNNETIDKETGNVICTSLNNLKLFKDELQILMTELDMEAEVIDIEIPYYEHHAKQLSSFKKICQSYKYNSKLFVDLTYGSKMTIINEFASLIYAERVQECDIAEILYGQYNHVKNDGTGLIYDVRSLYELNTLIQTASNIPHIDISKILDMIEGE